MHSSIHRADTFARGILAMLTSNTLVGDLRVMLVTGEITVNIDPRHLAANRHLMLTNDRNVVLALAGHNAGVAADARGQVDHHAPLLTLNVHQLGPAHCVVPKTALVVALPHVGRCRHFILNILLPRIPTVIPFHEVRCVVDAVQVEMLYEILVAGVVVGIALAHHRPPVHNSLLLRAGDFIGIACGLELGPGGHMPRSGGSRLVGIEPGVPANPAHAAAIAKRNAHGVVGHAG